MGDTDTLRLLMPVAATLAALLVAGVAALCHLAWQPAPPGDTWQVRVRRLASQSPWQWRDLGWILLLVAIAQAIRIVLPNHLIWDQAAFQGVLVAGILWRTAGKSSPFGQRLRWRTAGAQAILRWLAILPILWFTAFAWQLLLRLAGHLPDFQYAIRLFIETSNPWARAGFLVFAIGIAPLVEEVLFRGILLPLMVRRLGTGPGLLLNAAGFAALHGDLGAFPALMLLAVALSLAYARTGSLRVPILMHLIFNGANLLLLLGLLRAGVV
jgi:membrane protease YdiL (CAAX protease family)